ncbi:hypothetical protein OQA88_10220 [Cercophora sp. LCS_1]
MDDSLSTLTLQPATTLLTLPSEIIAEIAHSLCIHCTHHSVASLSEPEIALATSNQTAIAHLSQSSTRLRAITQPILFHFSLQTNASHIATRARVAALVRALALRPDLASQVKTLVLWTPTNHEFLNLSHEERVALSIKDDGGVIKRAAEGLGDWWIGRQYGSLLELQELAVGLASRAESVLLQRSFLSLSSAKTWLGWPLEMACLKEVVLVGFREGWRKEVCSYHLKEARAFLKQTPNLESLVLVDCGGDGGDFFVHGSDELKALPWGVELPKLRKLSINGQNVGAQEVEAIISGSSVFEDLEFFEGGVEFGRDVLELKKHLGTATKTLKRLCYSVFPIKARLREEHVAAGEEYEASDGDDEEDYFDPTWDGLVGFEEGFSLEEFSALEQLELEQLVLYGPVFEEPDEVENDKSRDLVTTDQFLAKLPLSLRHLRIGCVFYWPIVFRDMLALSGERARFPNLRSVALEVRRTPPRGEHDCLVEAFKTAGITLSICHVVRDPFSRGMLPPRPGFEGLFPRPVSYSQVE